MTFAASPFSRLAQFLRHRASQRATAFADALLLFSLALVCFPHHPWLCPLAALAPLVPLWINALSARRTGSSSVFVPDPLSPNYGAFLSSFVLSAEQVASGETNDASWTLCPVCGKDGAFIPYSLDFIPARHVLILQSADGTHKAETEVLFHPRLALPATVTDAPCKIKIRPSGIAKEVLLAEDTPAHLAWNNPHGNNMRLELVKGILAATLMTHALFPESAILTPDRLAILTAALLLGLFKAK